jgi:hypothetical protein
MQAGTRANWAAGGNLARYAVGDTPNVRVKLVVNEPMLCSRYLIPVQT